MGALFRFPFYITGVIIWIFLGGVITIAQFLFLPASFILSFIVPSMWGSAIGNTLKFKTLRTGFSNLYVFLRGY